MRKWFGCIVVAGVCLALPVPTPSRADDAAQIFGGILGAIINDQSRQQQQQIQQQQQQQYRQQQQQQYRQQQQQQSRARQPAAPRPQQPEMSLAERMAVQRALAQAGYYSGVIDGILGGGSRQAIASWQASLGAPATGYLLPSQARNLVEAAPPAPAPAWPAPGQTPGGTGMAGTGTPQPVQGGAGMALFPEPAPASENPAGLPAPGAATDQPARSDAGSSAEVLTGMDQLHAAFLFWALAQHPEQTWAPGLANDYRYFPLMPDGSRPPPETSPAQIKSLVEGAIALRRDRPPRRAVMDLPVSSDWLQSAEPGPAGMVRLMLPAFKIGFDDIGGVPAITRLKVHDTNGHNDVKTKVEPPFFLEPPADYRTAWAHPPDSSANLLLRIEIELSDLKAEPILTQRRTIGQARATIRRATLLLHDRPIGMRSDPPGPDRILHVWEGGAAAPAAEVTRPSTAEQIAAIYGVNVQDGRVLTQMPRPGRGQPPAQAPKALLMPDGAISDFSQPLHRLKVALTLTAIMDRGPERPLGEDAASIAMQMLLSERERLELFPMIAGVSPGGGSDASNKLAFRRALNEQEPELRRRIAGRTPQLPLPMRAIIPARLNEYDFDAGGFALYLDGQERYWLPNLYLGTDRALVPAFLRIGEEDAQNLLTYLEQIGGQGNQNIYVVLDFSLVQIRTRPGMQGRITDAELEVAASSMDQRRTHVESIALFADPGAQSRIRDLPVPPELQASDDPDRFALPDEVYLTSAKSLMGAVAAGQPEALAQGLLDSDEIRQIPEARRQGVAATYRQEMLDLARDSYWIGALLRTGSYDPAIDGFPIKGVEFLPMPYRDDTTWGQQTPQLRPQRPGDFAVLSVPDNQAVDISARRDSEGNLAALIKVGVTGTLMEENRPVLLFGPPEEVILGSRSEGFVLPETAELRVALTRPDPLAALAADPAKPEGAPAALMLDAEGIDLLALAQQPGLYDDDAYRRMLAERLLKERAHAGNAAIALSWGNFFKNPAQDHDIEQLQSQLLEPFRQWTQARLAMLPKRALLPVGSYHPLTACPGLVEFGSLPDDGTDFLRANAQALLGFAPDPGTPPLQLAAEREQVIPERFWTRPPAMAEASHCGPAAVTDEGRGTPSGLPAAAGHVALIAHVQAQPDLPRRDAWTLGAASFELDLTGQRLLPLEGLAQVPAGLRAVLLLTGPVVAVQGYADTGDGPGNVPVLDRRLEGPEPETGPAAMDVLGMKLGMPLAGFEAAAREHLPQAVLHRTTTAGKGLFGQATGFLDPARHEALAAVHSADGQSVAAIMRWLEFDPAEVSLDGIKASLIEKYGPLPIEYGAGSWSWGALPVADDPLGFCGGASTLTGQNDADLPQMVAEGAPGPAPEDGRLWRDLGWPATVGADQPGTVLPDLARCAPVVTARTGQRDGRIVLKLWLMDRRLVEPAETAEAPVAEPARPKVKF